MLTQCCLDIITFLGKLGFCSANLWSTTHWCSFAHSGRWTRLGVWLPSALTVAKVCDWTNLGEPAMRRQCWSYDLFSGYQHCDRAEPAKYWRLQWLEVTSSQRFGFHCRKALPQSTRQVGIVPQLSPWCFLEPLHTHREWLWSTCFHHGFWLLWCFVKTSRRVAFCAIGSETSLTLTYPSQWKISIDVSFWFIQPHSQALP